MEDEVGFFDESELVSSGEASRKKVKSNFFMFREERGFLRERN